MKKVCFLFLLAACLVRTGIPQQVGTAARVNGTEITVFRLERFFDEYSRSKGGGFQLITNPTVYKRLKREALDRLIDREVLWQEAQKRRIEISDREVEAALSELQSKLKTREAYLRKLRTMGFDEPSYAAYVRQDLSIERLLEVAVEPDKVTDDDIEGYYLKNPDQFVRPESVRVRHILIKAAEDADAESRKTAGRKAADLLDSLKRGEDFAELARQYSDDSTADAGGDLGWIVRGQMVRPFEDAVFGLEPAQISDVVETVFGFHIIKAEEKRPAAKVQLNEVKDLLRQFLERIKRQEAADKLLQRLRSEATIERVLPL